MSVIELRSDTFTQPTQAMREKIAEAVVGDDVFGEDPSVNQLEEKVAKLLGMEAALFVPSGTMANQIAINVNTQPGDEVLVGAHAHNRFFECGAAGFISGVQMTSVTTTEMFSVKAFEEAYHAPGGHYAPTRLLSIENTHNVGGGLVWPQSVIDEMLTSAKKHGIKTHLDGARIWNAATYQQTSPAELCKGFDTVSVCLSKGLGAPVGSLLISDQDTIDKSRRVRRILGGGMRQAGFLATAGIFALDNHYHRLTEDHENARLLALGINELSPFTVNLDNVQTNILMVNCPQHDAYELAEKSQQKGLLFFPLNKHCFRLVTHLNVTQAECEKAITLFSQLGQD